MYNLVLRYSIASAVSVLIAAIAIFAYNWEKRMSGLKIEIGLPNRVLLDSFIGFLDPSLKQFIADYDTLDLTTPENSAKAKALGKYFQRLLPPPSAPLLKVTLLSPKGRAIYSTHPGETGSILNLPPLPQAVLAHGHPQKNMIDTTGFQSRAATLREAKVLVDHQPLFLNFIHPIADPIPPVPHADKPIAVFTTYSDLTPAIARIRRESFEMMGLVSGVFASVYAVLLTFVFRAQRILRRQYDQLARQSMTDGLTEIANRRRFDDFLHIEWARATRTQTPLSLILVDVDHFKIYNDHYGHAQGDNCLKTVANVIEQTLERSGDLAARYGGEEFACVLPDTSEYGARLMAEKIRAAIEGLELPHTANGGCLTVSIGHATQTPQQGHTLKSLLETADTALYRAKDAGRNCVFGTEPAL